MSVLIRPQADQTSGIFCTVDITPETAGWQYVSFAVYHLTRGQTFRGAAKGRETALVVLYGVGRAELNGRPVGQIGERLSVFENKAPYALYLSDDASCQVECTSDDMEIAVASAPTTHQHLPIRVIRPQDVSVELRGEGNTQRRVQHILDTDQPADGFAFQRVYNYEGFDETVAVHDGDLVLVPKGYHVVSAVPGCDLYYLNVMAGPHREWHYQVDPAFHRLLPPSGKITGSIVRPAGGKEG